MAINKVVNNRATTHGAMRNSIEYILRDDSLEQDLLEITGPYDAETINYDEVYQTWLAEKRLWNKDSGRMYAHNIISFHKDEMITPEQVLEISRAFVERFFPEHQCLIAVHHDKEHLHCHILTNSVSYVDGHKLHQTKRDLEQQKKFTNELCRDRGLSIAEKGHHFDGTSIEPGEIRSWSKDKYNLLINDTKKSFVADCGLAIMDVMSGGCFGRDDFIAGMAGHGWSVQWEDNRRHIVFENEDGDKVRDSRIEKTFEGLEVNKEALEHEFERQNEIRLEQLRAEQASAAAREREEARRRELEEYERANEETGGDDIEAFLRDINAEEQSARAETRNSRLERVDREAERERQAIERSIQLEISRRRSRSHELEISR